VVAVGHRSGPQDHAFGIDCSADYGLKALHCGRGPSRYFDLAVLRSPERVLVFVFDDDLHLREGRG